MDEKIARFEAPTLNEALDKIRSVSADDVLRVARELLGGPLTVSVLGNLKGYRPRLPRLRR